MTKVTTTNYLWVIGDTNRQNPAAADIKQTFRSIDAKVHEIEVGVLVEPQRSILMTGLLSARPAAATNLEGYRYKATDVRATYYCDGTIWIDDGGSTVTVNGVPPNAVTGDIPLTPEDLGFDLADVTAADIGGVLYPAGGSDGNALLKSGSAAVWGTVSGGGSTAAEALFGGAGIWGAQRKPLRTPALSSVLTTFQAGHLWTGGTDDSSYFRFGSQSLRLDAPVSASALSYVTSPTMGSTIDLVANCLELMVSMSSDGFLFPVQIEVSSNGGTNWVVTSQASLTGAEYGREIRLCVNKDSFTSTTNVNFLAINRIRVGARTLTTGTTSNPVYFNRVGVYAATEAKASFTFLVEASSASFSVYEEFIKRGIRATLAIRPFNVVNGLNGAMTFAQLQELHFTHGFGVVPQQWSNSEVNPNNYLTTNPVEFETGLLKCLQWQKYYGFERPRMWYSGINSIGNTNVDSTKHLLLARRYFESSAVGGAGTASNTPVIVMPAANPHSLLTAYSQYFSSAWTTSWQNYVDRVVESKSHGIYTGGGFIEAASGTGNVNNIGRTDIAALLDYILSKGSAIEILTANEFVEKRL